MSVGTRILYKVNWLTADGLKKNQKLCSFRFDEPSAAFGSSLGKLLSHVRNAMAGLDSGSNYFDSY